MDNDSTIFKSWCFYRWSFMWPSCFVLFSETLPLKCICYFLRYPSDTHEKNLTTVPLSLDFTNSWFDFKKICRGHREPKCGGMIDKVCTSTVDKKHACANELIRSIMFKMIWLYCNKHQRSTCLIYSTFFV